MKLLDLTLATPAENLALDEALLNQAESLPESTSAGVLRLWESPEPFVVAGRATRLQEEVNLKACEADGIPVLRRCSGGTSVVAGPGCLMYAVVLSYRDHPDLKVVDAAHRHVMSKLQRALAEFSPDVQFRGTCDLCLGELKFSGNALRCKRSHLLYHGTVLYDFPLDRIERWLGDPPRQPEYRQNRSHESFITNFPFPVADLRAAICREWQAAEPLEPWPREATEALVASRYTRDTWHRRLL